MKHAISMAVALCVLWLMLSAHFEPLLLGLGIVSVLLTLILSLRMDLIDHESHPFHLTFHLLAFWVLLAREIIKANIDVVLRILGIRPISPTLITVPVPHKTDLARVIYANSITLTPGTASIEVDQNKIVVHSLSREAAEDLKHGYLASIVPDIEEIEIS
ncbi:MAG: Na+/H+ antiporter subunit E [Gammaproteobacteria bacterium]|nr:Na+/H+ antiporter subunit E [Gammaproteobacteria bacterium]